MYHLNTIPLAVMGYLLGLHLAQGEIVTAVLWGTAAVLQYLIGWQADRLMRQQALADEIEAVERSMDRRGSD